MCGIAGVAVVGDVGSQNLSWLVRGMVASIAHRGPDDHGVKELHHQFSTVALGSCRLAIQDLSSAGHQPMVDPTTGNWIVFNGEIYNFQQLRADLAAEGVVFRSSSDTEVLLAAYGRYGTDCLGRLRGMFAFALWDARAGYLVLARDRLGEKPLYYTTNPGPFLFASEIRALRTTDLVSTQVSVPGVASFLALGAVRDPLTIFEGIASLPPAHFAIWCKGRLTLKRYWALPNPPAALVARSRADVVAQLRAQLEEAVRLQLISDVPLGAFLSGGIDSTAIVSLMCRVGNVTPRTVSIVFPESEFSETSYMRLVAQRLETQHTEVVLSGDDLLSELPRATAAMDQPTVDGINTYIVSKWAKSAGLTVSLSGLGGDELFAGYANFHTVPLLEAARRWMPRRLGQVTGQVLQVYGRSDRFRKMGRWLDGRDLDDGAYALARELFGPRARRSLLQWQALPALPGLPEGSDSSQDDDVVNRVSRHELTDYMANMLLRDTDIMSMAHSLEVRVPFLDHHLVESVMSLPGSLKVSGAAPKSLLVEAIGGAFPIEVAQRQKMGFVLPLAEWMRGPLKQTIEAVLLEPEAGHGLNEILDPIGVRAVWTRFLRGEANWVRPWALYALKAWAAQLEVSCCERGGFPSHYEIRAE